MREFEVYAKTRKFKRRVDHALAEVRSAVAAHERWVVSSSWGKDSCALAGLVHEAMGPGFHVSHLRSPYELPGYERVVDWFSERCVIHAIDTQRSLTDYITWLQEYGLGIHRETRQKVGRARKAGELSVWSAEQGVTLQLLGMRADESLIRRRLFRSRGLTYQRADGSWISNPLGWWSVTDVWAYLVSRGIPWHPLYDCETHGMDRKRLRNAGWLTVQSDVTDWRLPWLRQHYPEQWRWLADAFPEILLHS